MKTPYDTALRAIQREVDDLRVSIGAAADRLMQADTLCRAMGDTLRIEADLAASDWTFSPQAYFARARARRARLMVEQDEANARLEALRQQAVTSYGSMRAIEEAAGLFRSDAERASASIEQATMDDLAGARFFHAVRAARRLADS